MDRGPEAAPADEDPGLLPMICRASGNVLTSVGEYLIGAHPEPPVPLPAAEQNEDMSNADGQEPEEAAAAVRRQQISSEDDQRGNTDDGDGNHEQITGEAEGSNGNQAAAAADDQDATGPAGASESEVDAIDLENDKSASGTLRVGHNEGEGGEERRRVVVTIESDDSDSEASQATGEVIEHDGGEGLAAVVADDTSNDERTGEAVAEVPAELRLPLVDGELEAVRRRPLRALLLMCASSGALSVLLTLWAVSGDLFNVRQGQAVLLHFGGDGSMSALNDFSNDNTITGLRFIGVMATEGKQRNKVKFDVKLDKIDSRSTTSSDSGAWGAIRWPTFGGGKEGAGGKDATVNTSTKKKDNDVEPKRKGFGREVGRLDATRGDRRKSQGVGDNNDESSASGGSILSRVKRFFGAIGSWLREDILQADYIFAEGWID